MDAIGALICCMGRFFLLQWHSPAGISDTDDCHIKSGDCCSGITVSDEDAGTGLQLNRQILKAFFGMSFLNNVVPFSLIVLGQQHIASGVASILNATTSLSTMLVANWFTNDEKINPRRLLGVLTGVGGVGLMMGLDSRESF